MKKRNLIILITIFTTLFVAGIVSAVFLYSSTEFYSGKLKGNNRAEILIKRDKAGIPTIKAENYEDFYYALGFVHALDRFEVIDYYRLMARGELASIVGDEVVVLDRLARLIDFRGRAEKLLKDFTPVEKNSIEAYVRGINFYREQKGVSVARFFKQNKSGWDSADILAIYLFLDWAESFNNNRELVFPLEMKSNTELVNELIPEGYEYRYLKEERSDVEGLLNVAKLLERNVGSNISGIGCYLPSSMSSNNHFMIGLNLDSNVKNYPCWYPVKGDLPSGKFESVTVSGLPFVFYNKTDNFAYAGFRLNMDTQNFYYANFQKQNNVIVQMVGGSTKPVIMHTEKIEIKGKSTEDFTYPEISNGIVISSVYQDKYRGETVAMDYIEPDMIRIHQLWTLPLCQNIDEASRLFEKNNGNIPQVFVLASDNYCRITYSGRVLDKNKDVILANSYEAESGWKNINSSKKIEQSSVLFGSEFMDKSSFSKMIVRENIKRALRFEYLLRQLKVVSNKELEEILRDSYSPLAELYVPAMKLYLQDMPIPSARLTRLYLHDWNLKMDNSSIPASIFNVFMINIVKYTISDECGDEAPLLVRNYYLLSEPLYILLKDKRSRLFDDIGTAKDIEEYSQVVDKSFLKSLKFLNENFGPKMEFWEWGKIHTGHFYLPIAGDSKNFKRLFYGMENLAVCGDFFTVNKGGIDSEKPMTSNEMTVLSLVYGKENSELGICYNMSLKNSALFSQPEIKKNGFSGFMSLQSSDYKYQLMLIPQIK